MEARKVIVIKKISDLNLPSVFSIKRVVAYARVSTSSEEQLNSVEAQKLLCMLDISITALTGFLQGYMPMKV